MLSSSAYNATSTQYPRSNSRQHLSAKTRTASWREASSLSHQHTRISLGSLPDISSSTTIAMQRNAMIPKTSRSHYSSDTQRRVRGTTTKTHIRPSLTDDAARNPRDFRRDYIVCVVFHPRRPEHHPNRPRLDFPNGNTSPRRRLSQRANTSSAATRTRPRKLSLKNNPNPDRRTSASDDSGNGRCAASRRPQCGATHPIRNHPNPDISAPKTSRYSPASRRKHSQQAIF